MTVPGSATASDADERADARCEAYLTASSRVRCTGTVSR